MHITQMVTVVTVLSCTTLNPKVETKGGENLRTPKHILFITENILFIRSICENVGPF